MKYKFITKWPEYFFIGLILLYQLLISPFKTPCCRFLPTCSEYFLEAIKEHGLLYGCYLGIKRLAKCHFLSEQAVDLVPVKKCRHEENEI